MSGTILRQLIRTDGTVTNLDRPVTMAEAHQLIGAEGIDVVALHHLGLPLHVMLVDDMGYEYEVIDHGGGRSEHRAIRPLKPINAKATELYHCNCRPGTTHQIVGDVVIVPDDDYAVEGDPR